LHRFLIVTGLRFADAQVEDAFRRSYAAIAAGEMIVADAALRFDLPLGVRIGIHVGPLIGGVVGQLAPIYDFWGDTLNVVNDLEAASEIGKIHCSEPFYWRLGEAWQFEHRGPREFRGVGTLRTFYLLGPAEAAGNTATYGA
jgi:class 3 adenylate cyclase